MFGILWWLGAVVVVGFIVWLVGSFRKHEKVEYEGIPYVNDLFKQVLSDKGLRPPDPPPPPLPERESKGEGECRRVLETLFQRPFPRVRPAFMKNPLTGRNLELDGYCEDLLLAFEYNGRQHVHSKGQDTDTFLKQVRRDVIKNVLADKAGVYLITVPHTVPVVDIEKYIRERLPQTLLKYIEG